MIGAYTGGGMSLVDAGMVPFQKAYVMICKSRLAIRRALGLSQKSWDLSVVMIVAILAGNHGLVRLFFRPAITQLDLTTGLVPANFVRVFAIR